VISENLLAKLVGLTLKLANDNVEVSKNKSHPNSIPSFLQDNNNQNLKCTCSSLHSTIEPNVIDFVSIL